VWLDVYVDVRERRRQKDKNFANVLLGNPIAR